MTRFFARVRALALPAILGFAVASATARADSLAVVDPLPPGPYAVGCSNIAQDFSRLQPGESAQNYWEGYPDGGRERYVTQLLSDPADALVVNVTVPDDRELYTNRATQQVPFALLVCYPTTADNPYPDYPLPSGRAVPHMQQGAQPPIFADASTATTAQWPVLLFSHGLVGSPISSDYIAALTVLASYGYVVVAPFHGDPRFTDVKIDNLSDFLYALLHFGTFVEMQALRPLSLSRALDYLFAHPQYSGHLDVNRVGGFGASQGGESLLLMTGAKLTISVGMSSKQVLADPRLKAIVGYVPYLGQPFFPAFGRDQSGLDGISTPFLAISGGADLTAPLETTLEGVDRLSGSRDVVVLAGVDHGFDIPSTNDIFTWSMTFLAAHVNDDRVARVRIARMTTVRGGGDDFLVRDYTAPSALLPGELDTIEYFGAALGDYFLTADPAEEAVLDAGLLPGWVRTGFAFKSWSTGVGHGVAACRFFGKPGPGPYAHFYTIDPVECAFVAASPGWIFEGLPFSEDAPSGGDCAADRIPVMRVYNNFMDGQVGHRFLTSKSEIISMIADGWLYEGVAFCSPP